MIDPAWLLRCLRSKRFTLDSHGQGLRSQAYWEGYNKALADVELAVENKVRTERRLAELAGGAVQRVETVGRAEV